MKTSQTGFWYRLLALLLSLLLAACGGNTGGGSTSGTANTPGGPVQVTLQGGSFTQGPTSAQVNAQGFQTPYGGISFTAQVSQAGGTLTVTLTFPQDLPQGAVLLKCLNGNCTPIQGAQLQGRTAT
ncbi:MAG: choice-of-anchor U domain-containing protein, partial [Thermus caldifontis]